MANRTCIVVNELFTPQFHGPNSLASFNSSGGSTDPCKNYLHELADIAFSEACSKNDTKLNLELAAKKQQDILRAINTNLFGLQSCIFNPRFDTSVYQQEDQDFHYPVIPDFEGKLLIEGLQNILRYSGEDQWSSPEITLYWSRPNIFEIKENAKIVVHHGDQRVSLRSANRRRQMGQFIELYETHSLIPFN